MGRIIRDDRLAGVKDALILTVRKAAIELPFDIFVVEGVRTEARQRELFTSGKSRTLKSKHIAGRAVDIVPYSDGRISWGDRKKYAMIKRAMMAAAEAVGVKVRTGSDWDMNAVSDEDEVAEYKRKFGHSPLVDYPHWELV